MAEIKAPYLKLKAYLVENNIKQKDVAEKLGITATSFNSKIHRNGQDFTLKEVRALCKLYNLDSNEFFLL